VVILNRKKGESTAFRPESGRKYYEELRKKTSMTDKKVLLQPQKKVVLEHNEISILLFALKPDRDSFLQCFLQ